MDNCALPEVCPEHAHADPKNGAGTFGGAIVALKRGAKVARAGWNGKGMHLYLICAMPLSALVDGASAVVIGEPCIVMFTAQGKYQPGWLASQADMLAEDWVIVP